MSDLENSPSGSNENPESYTTPGMKNATLNYVLYLLGFLVPFIPIVGLVFAYMSRGKAGAEVDSHYTFQIRTFWIAFAASFVALILSFILIGFLGFIAIAIWVIIRCVKGLMASSNNKPIEDPQTYLF